MWTDRELRETYERLASKVAAGTGTTADQRLLDTILDEWDWRR
jgi:hypothetical protein